MASSLICKDCNVLFRSVKEAEVGIVSWLFLQSLDHRCRDLVASFLPRVNAPENHHQ